MTVKTRCFSQDKKLRRNHSLDAGWFTNLGNVQRFITRVEPLYDSLNPLFCDVFASVAVSARSLLLWSIKSLDVDLISVLFASIFVI